MRKSGDSYKFCINDLIREDLGLAYSEPGMRRLMRLHSFKSGRPRMALQTIIIIEANARADGFVIGSRNVSCQMTEPGHFRLQISAEAVIAVAVEALVLGNPPVFVMTGCQRAAVRIFHIVHHRQHDMAIGAPANFMGPFERVIARQENGAGRQNDQASKSDELGECQRGKMRDSQVDLPLVRLDLIETSARNIYAKTMPVRQISVPSTITSCTKSITT